MALRPSKITSDILQSCTKYLSTSADVTIKSTIPASFASQKDQFKYKTSSRYRLGNTDKPEELPEVTFRQDDNSGVFAELQPSLNPEFRFDFDATKWAEKSTSSPFPTTIKPKERVHTIYTDQQKAEDKMLKYKMTYFSSPKRHFSTVRRYSKGPAENSGSGKCPKKAKKCYQERSRDCRVPNKDCPRLKLCDCEQSKGSNCKLNYLDPNCTKKFAPYPSYSESCAENLPDDPSECQQCPWRTCDGVDRIEPGKPVRHKRHYSTSCSRHLTATAGVVGCSALPPSLVAVQEHLFGGKCGRTKKPCKEPPSPCEVRKQKEEQRKKEKGIHIPPKPKKASEELSRMVLNSGILENGPEVILNPNTLRSSRLSLDQPLIENKCSWVDIIEPGEEMFLNENQKHPNCHKKKKPKRPKTGPSDKNLTIEYGNADWWSGRGKKTVIIGNRDPSDTRDCRLNKCRKVQIKSKKNSLNNTEMLLSKKGKKKIKGDEGHPPPCVNERKDSLNCPEKPLKKPKYKKRPMEQGYYKRPEDPYNKANGAV